MTASFRNDGRLKLVIVVGTRPEVIRLSAIIERCRESFDTLLLHTGQNYDDRLSGIFFRELGLGAPDILLRCAGDGAGAGAVMGRILAETYEVFERTAPDAVLVLGDTNSCLCVLSAKRLRIPVFHMEAGNRCGDARVPEELNRRVVDVASDVNLAYSEQARSNLLASGLPQNRCFVVGSPMAEVLRKNLGRIRSSPVLSELSLEKGRYFLLSAHREENLDLPERFSALFGAVNAIAEAYDLPVVYACHPRSRKKLQTTGFPLDRRVLVREPFGFLDYNCLQINARAVLSDSGTLAEESAFFASEGLGFPAVSLRDSTERPEAMERGCFVLGGTGREELLRALALALDAAKESAIPAAVPAYADCDVSRRVVHIIQSYAGVAARALRGSGT